MDPSPDSFHSGAFALRSRSIYNEIVMGSYYKDFGYSVGAWTPEDEEEAEMAVRGEYFLTGENAMKRRVKA